MGDDVERTVLVNDDGVRTDGRKADQIRPIRMELGPVPNADGSAYVQWGNNKVLAAVYGPREAQPKYLQDPLKAVVQVNYNMAAFAGDDRVRPGPNRRATEISKITAEALERVVLTNQFPRTLIEVYVEVVEADAGTRCAGLTAASLALAHAGIPMRDLVAACAVGKADDQIILDPGKLEDNMGQADMPLGFVPGTGEIVLLQMDGHMTPDEMRTALEMGMDACRQVHAMEVEALRNTYARYLDADGPDREVGE